VRGPWWAHEAIGQRDAWPPPAASAVTGRTILPPAGHGAPPHPPGRLGQGSACAPGPARHAGPATDGTARTPRSPPRWPCAGSPPVRQSAASRLRDGREAMGVSGAPRGLETSGAPLPRACPRLGARPPTPGPPALLPPRGAPPGAVSRRPWRGPAPAARGARVGRSPAPSAARAHGRQGSTPACAGTPALVLHAGSGRARGP